MNQFPFKQIKNIGILLWFSIISFLIFYLFVAHFYGSEGTGYFDHFGSFIGGVFGTLLSFISVILVIYTIRQQQTDQEKQQIEARFFELLKIHRENVYEMKLPDREGKYIFVVLLRELFKIYIFAKKANKQTDAQYSQTEIINVTFLAFFFGCSGPNSPTFKSRTKSYDTKFISNLVKECSIYRLQQSKNNQFEIKRSDSIGATYKYFDGHQIRLSHYFRHLFQTINYINNSDALSYQEKYQYIKILRAQLSNQEQVLLFVNSISDLGKEWEQSQDDVNKKLITKYNLIKNIPEGFTRDINLTSYYPHIILEGKNKSIQRMELEKAYR
jgi:hypothetical protein